MSCRPPPEHGPSGGAPTLRQQEVLAYVHVYKKRNGIAPAASDLCERFGWSNKAAAYDYLDRLEKARLLTRAPFVHRSSCLTASGEAVAEAYLRVHPELAEVSHG
ncbi:LexA family protein [Corallococcus sp. RDP092CA]|uniref:LexA family protein n=1 Tax=Corallococcus sp. RDP092CA TaxID=3109369 RepID=UPI0035B24890